jgi:mannan endo-1,4-beta-mannosidase
VRDHDTTGPRPSRRAVLLGGAATAGLATIPAGRASAATTGGRPPRGGSANTGWVTVHGRRFRVGGKAFRFAGTNTYYLHQQSHYMIDAALDDAAAMGLKVVRAWAFADGSGQSFTPLQPHPFEYDDDAFDPLDYAVHKAGLLGIRLVLTLTNNWPDYGGMQQYVQWFLGLDDDSYADAVHHDRFYDTASIKKCYKAWVRHVIRRKNPYTGHRYGADPTIMTFELANEPRNRSDKTGQTLLSWADEMSRYVKSLAPHQLVAVGDEGFYGDPANADYPYSDYEGNHWKQLVALDAVDYGTVHLYPQHWGDTAAKDPAGWGTTWISDHLRDGARLRKPVVIEEYGLNVSAGTVVPDEAARTAAYRTWTRTVEEGGGSDQFWLLTSRVDDGSFYPDYDGYRIVWRADDTNPTRETAAALAAHAKTMNGS